MPYVTITGAAGTGVVQTLVVTSAATQAMAQAAANNINAALLAQNYTDVNINSVSNPSGFVVGSLGQTAQGGSATLTALNIPNNVQSLTINNSGNTVASNNRFIGSETVLSGNGNLTFTDNGSSTAIITGGGNNTITFSNSSANGFFVGDGNNTINVNAAAGSTSVFGTAASSDTIVGSASGPSSIVYTSAAGASAFINPLLSNVTVFGANGAGTETVYGSGANAFTGRLTVTDGTGLFAGGTAGNNLLGSSTVGSTTLIGGGSGDQLVAKGAKDILIAASGAETLDGSNSAGGDFFFAGTNGTALMYAGKNVGDTFYTNTTTLQGSASALALNTFIDLHSGPNTLLRSLNTSVSSTIAVGFSNLGQNYATVGDFISNLDKVVLNTSVVGSSYSLTYGTVAGGSGPVGYTNLQTSNNSLITFYNATLTTSDIVKV